MSFLKALAIFCYLLTNHPIHLLDFQSRCPHLFLYEGRWTEPDKWYGVVVVVPDIDSDGVSFRLIFDRPVVHLGLVNVLMANISIRDNQEFVVQIPKHLVTKNLPHIVRFYVNYKPNEPVPNLIVFRVNDITVCPDFTIPSDSTIGMQLQTSQFSADTSENANGNEGPLYRRFSTTDSDDICGTVVVQPRRLHSGQTTYEGEFPWQGILYQQKKEGFKPKCGVSLISKYHVLTVAHCVTMTTSRISLQPVHLEVHLGVYYTERFYNYNAQRRDVLKIMIHPNYSTDNYDNNIAILKFIIPIDITDYVRPVCLWEDPVDLRFIADKQGYIVGWGLNDYEKATEYLMHVNTTVVSQKTCISNYPGFYSYYAASRTYCAGILNDQSVCSILAAGNGMAFPKSNSNQENPRWQLRGLTSIAVITETTICDPSHYIVFTDVAAHLEWIRRSLQ